jgi:hypothetical protein
MLPKKQPTVPAAYVAKCTKSGQKHGQPLHDSCPAVQWHNDEDPSESEETTDGNLATQDLGEGSSDVCNKLTGVACQAHMGFQLLTWLQRS